MLEAPVVLLVMFIALITLIVLGFHIFVVLGMVSLVGTYLLFGDLGITLELASSSAYAVLRNAVFAAIPLFVLMGEFMSRAGMATDLYKIANYFLRKLPGRLAIATVLGNAVFAAVTGVSIASAMTFSRIAYPEMMKFGYNRSFALGSIAGSASLGMLIPPSVILIVWGIIIEKSIGKLFLAGFIPGLILALLMGIYVSVRAGMKPELAPSKVEGQPEETVPTGVEIVSGLGVIVLILLVLGGLFAGYFTPMESAAVGCGGAIIFSYIKGLRWAEYRTAVVDSGKTIAPILVLLMTAAMYAKFLALGSVVDMIQDIITGMGLGSFGITVLMIIIWLALGTLIDSISIILLTVP
ncbi:MAG: C4-dicarboxylate ABC transporter permease, partial [Rhodospirillaceae bacterium]|nr:C4-dicarboxylate ABC transporter permease [Rhodospirillaceae bacterium]